MNSIRQFGAVTAAALLLCHASLFAEGREREQATFTGDPAPDLIVNTWAQGEPVAISSLKGKKCAVLYFWTVNQQVTAGFPVAAELARKYAKDVQFIGVGIDKAEDVKKFFMLPDLPFPVAVDETLVNVDLYMREHDRVPMAAVINRDGLLVWRDPIEAVGKVLDEVLSGKFDLTGAVEREKYSMKVMAAMMIKDYDTVLKLLDEELDKNPATMELLNMKVKILAQLLNRPADAIAALDQAIAAQPKNIRLYEMAIQVWKEADDFRKLGPLFDRIIAEFSDTPMLLVNLAQQEMNQPVGELRLENALKLTHAAYHSNHFQDDREKGLVTGEYARSVYYCGRPDKALELSKEAMTLLIDTPEYEKARSYVTYYNTVMTLSRIIK